MNDYNSNSYLNEEDNKNLTKCPACGVTIAKSAKSCPVCGAHIKKPIYKRWWFIAIIVLIIVIVIGNAIGSDNNSDSVSDANNSTSTTTSEPADTSDSESNDNQEASKPAVKTYNPGTYKIGTDLSSGTYVIIGSGYMELDKDSTGELESIITNDNYVNQIYINVKDGEYLEFTDGTAYKKKDAPAVDTSGDILQEGMYRAGRDFKPGEYKITADDDMAYMEVSKSSRGSIYDIVTNDNFSGDKYITVSDGQYLKMSGCHLILK